MPIRLYAAIATSLIFRKKRSLRADCMALLRHYPAGIDLRNADRIPEKGPFLVTMNHYSRPGFFILWAAAAISAALPHDSLWLMTAAWTKRTQGMDRLRTALTKAIFGRLAEIYGLVTMPAMPPAQEEAAERALSIRRLIKIIKAQPEAILCIAPEGMDFPGGKLGAPYPGTGRLLLQAAAMLKRVLPIGVYEEDGRLVIRFGEPYILDPAADPDNMDAEITRQVMRRIAALLPEGMRGVYL